MSETEKRLISIRDFCRQELSTSINFWLEYGMDRENGGVYTCLDRTGKIYSTDKSVWMQGRCGWIFAYLCNTYGTQKVWKEASKSCIKFLEKHCINEFAGGRLYFTVTNDGRPLRQRRYCFSEGFYCLANAEYHILTDKTKYLERARRACDMIYELNRGLVEDPTGLGPKTIPSVRSTLALADPMIYLNVLSVMRRSDPENVKEYDRRANECVSDILNNHFRPELGCTLESVNSEGVPEMDYTAGRVVNPGHDIECSWFLADEANYQQNSEIHEKAQKMFRFAIESGWDKEYGGLLYFIDALGKPTEAYEHDMKLWWPHNEIMIAASKFYRDTKDTYYLDWLEKTVDYCKEHFCDREFGEWYGYLRRDGKPTMPSTKGSTFKGPFHVPRALAMTERTLTEIIGDEK